jgi:nucleoside-diphosphate kinase
MEPHEDDIILSFVSEYFDPHSQLTKEYLLMLNTSKNEVEMNDIKTKRKFLKKTKLPKHLKVSDFTKGATVIILSRELLLVDYADKVTREHLEQNEETINVLVSPSVYGSLGDVVSSIEDHFPLVDTKYVAGNDDDVCVALTFRGCGSIASVSATVESSTFSHGLLACPNDAEVGKNRLTTATLDNCTCCIIRPHIVKERKVGAVVSDITSRGFTISTIQMVRLDKTASAEFLNIYKGVLPDYVDLVDEMASGPCLVLEVKKGSRSSSIDEEEDDIVEEFRMACGPWDHSVACELHPESIRAKFGTSSVKNAVHCTDLPKDGVIECSFFFK